MSDINGNGRASKGEQVYRALVSGGLLIIAFLSMRVIGDLDKMGAKIEALQLQVIALSSTTEGRLNAHTGRHDNNERRNDAQDVKIDELQRRVWRMPEGRTP